MKAVVMAGGEGSRLRALTVGRPKPMGALVNKPGMQNNPGLLKQHGLHHNLVAVQ